jgi:[histone H4]-lysine20 N-methyltransferase SETD8
LVFSGYGVKADREFLKGDFLMQYKGDVINEKEAAKREEVYNKDDVGCFMYYFKHGEKNMWYVSAFRGPMGRF